MFNEQDGTGVVYSGMLSICGKAATSTALATPSPELVLAVKHALNPITVERLRHERSLAANDTLNDLISDVVSRARRLRTAIADNAFTLAFQPIVRLADERITHHEVLVRFHEGESPAAAIRLAEELGFGAELDLAVVGSVVGMVQRRRRDHLDPMALAVNLSGYSLADPGFVDKLTGLLGSSGIPAGLLMFEVTESADVQSIDRLAEGIERLRRLGFSIGLDDLGAGASSLARLLGLPADFVKIDGGLIRNLGQNGRPEAVIKGICEICANLGIGVIGECVETEAQADTLRAIGAQCAQGWFFGRPLSYPGLTGSSSRTAVGPQ